jgi:hypothetical protein
MSFEQLNELLAKDQWPVGFSKAILDSKESVAFRFVVVDNSR